MVWTPSRDLLGRLLEEHLNGATPPDPGSFYLILTNGSAFTDSSTVADIVKSELVEEYGYSRAQYNPTPGSYNATQGRYQMPPITISFTATGGAIQFDRVVLLSNAKPIANKIFTANPANNRLTLADHNLTTGDAVVPTADTGSVLPSGIDSQLYYVKSVDVNTVELYADSSLTTIVDFSDVGSGTLRLRYASGNFEFYDNLGSSTIPDGATQNLVVYFNSGYAE